MKEGTRVGIYSDFVEIRESYNLFDSWDVSEAEINVKSTDFNVKSAIKKNFAECRRVLKAPDG